MFNKLFNKNKKTADQGEFEQVVQIIKEVHPELKNVDIQSSSKFEDLGFDSIKYINLMLSMEDIVNKDIELLVEELDFDRIKTVGDLVLFVVELKK